MYRPVRGAHAARDSPLTTVADFVSPLGEAIAHVFAGVLTVCDQQGLIGREMLKEVRHRYSVDGVKLPSNSSKRRSGTRADFERQAAKLETAAASMLTHHRAADTTDDGPPASPGGP